MKAVKRRRSKAEDIWSKGTPTNPVWKISTCLNNLHYNAPGELEESMNLAMPPVMETGHTFACSEHQSNFFTPCAIKHGGNSQGFQYENNPPWAIKLIWCSCGSPKSLVCFWRMAECITEVCLPCSQCGCWPLSETENGLERPFVWFSAVILMLLL